MPQAKPKVTRDSNPATRHVSRRPPGAYLGAVNRANLMAYQQYHPRPYCGQVALFCGDGCKVDSPEDRQRGGASSSIIPEIYTPLGDHLCFR